MTNQLQGEILFAGWSGSSAGDWAYTPWMPVRGDKATYAVEIIKLAGVTSLKWEVQTRDLEDPSTIDTPVSVQTQTAVGVLVVTPGATPARQLVRYRFWIVGTESINNYVIFRALQPSWQADR